MGQQHGNTYREQVKEVKSDMRWPHKLDIVCTGRGAHKQAALVQMWMDKSTGEITVLGWPVSRNEHNVAPRKIEDRYRQADGVDYVTCNRCNETRSFASQEFDQLLLETAWANQNSVDVSFAGDLIPFALQAAEDRETKTVSADTPPPPAQRGDWQNDPSIRPPWVARQDIWRAHAEHLNLNVKGMNRWQIVQTFRYYYPQPETPRTFTW